MLQASGNSLLLSLSGTFLADSALYATPIFHWPLHGASLPLNAKRIRQWSYRLSGGGSLTLASISSALRHSFRYGFARLPYSMHSRELYQESLERTTGLLRTGKSKFKFAQCAQSNRGNHCERYRIRNSIDTLHTANRVGRYRDQTVA